MVGPCLPSSYALRAHPAGRTVRRKSASRTANSSISGRPRVPLAAQVCILPAGSRGRGITMNATAPSSAYSGSRAMSRRDAEFLFPLPHIPEAVGLVRRRAHTVLTGWKLPATTIEDAVLVISELVTNAVTHARPPAMLQMSRTAAGEPRALRIAVTDAGPAVPVPRPADGSTPGRTRPWKRHRHGPGRPARYPCRARRDHAVGGPSRRVRAFIRSLLFGQSGVLEVAIVRTIRCL